MDSTESSIKFQQYWLMLKRHRLPVSAVFLSVFALTALSLLLQKPVYVAEGELLFKKTSTTSSLTGLGKEIGQLSPLQDQTSPLDTEAEIVRSVPITQKTITTLALKNTDGTPLTRKQFLKQLQVSHVKGTDVLQVSYKDTDPHMAAAVVNAVMAVYLENVLLANRAETVSAGEFIEQQLPQAEVTVRKAEVALRKFKEENEVVNLEEEAKSAVAVIADLQRQINVAQGGLADANAQSAESQKQLGMDLQEAATMTSISQSPAVQEVLKEVQQVESQLAIDRSRFQENHPTIATLKNRKAELQGLLQERLKRVLEGKRQKSNENSQISEFEQKLSEDFVRLETRRIGLANQVAALSTVEAAYRQRVNNVPRLEQQQRGLESQLQAAQTTYSLLLQKLQESKIAANQNVGNARVISPALVPGEPVAPRKALSLVTGVLLGSLFGVVTARILEAKDQSIRTVDEARKLFGFTLLGLIPCFKKSEKLHLHNGNLEQSSLERSTPEIVVRDSPRSPLSAAYRMLQTNLKSLPDKDKKVIVVTSSVPKEGKSTVSANLAVTMAQLGRKVLLVDADMHCPLQHQIWKLPNQLGLSNLLLGQAELRTTVKPVVDNLDVLTSGVMVPNPTSLLDSQQMALLIDMFSASYDFTIIDTPALNVDADAPILGKMAGGVLLVVRPGVVDSASATFAKEFLEQSGQNVLGQVINGVIPKNEPHSY